MDPGCRAAGGGPNDIRIRITTNYILTEMERGQSYADALAEAPWLGYAEADPTADVEGLDARAKVSILSNVAMGEDLPPKDIPCQGISHLTGEEYRVGPRPGQTIQAHRRAETKTAGYLCIRRARGDREDPPSRLCQRLSLQLEIVARSPVAQVAKLIALRPIPYRARVAETSLPRALASHERAWSARATLHRPRYSGTDSPDLADQSDLGIATHRRRTQ